MNLSQESLCSCDLLSCHNVIVRGFALSQMQAVDCVQCSGGGGCSIRCVDS